MRDGPVDFDPRQYRWRFLWYSRYTFTFSAIGQRGWYAFCGERSVDGRMIRYYRVKTQGSWDEITDGTCKSDAQVAAALTGDHEFVRLVGPYDR